MHDYLPDFLIRLDNHNTLVLEMNGIEDEQDREKYRALEEWMVIILVKYYLIHCY